MRPTLISLVAVAGCALGACYSPSFRNCEIACANEACPGDFTCSAGKCAAPGASCSTTDAGSDVPDGGDVGFYDLTWGPATSVAQVANATLCERSPILDPSMTYLLIARPTVASIDNPQACVDTARIVRYEWRDGSPASPTQLSVRPDHAIDLPVAVLGVGNGSGNVQLLYTGRGTATAPPDLFTMERTAALDEDSAVTTGAATVGTLANASPTFTADRGYVVYDQDGDLFETTGTYPVFVAGEKIDAVNLNTLAEAEFSPALSPDGRVLVFVRTTGGTMGATRLWESRRRSRADPWGEPREIDNTDINALASFQYDPFIAANGDLLFTSTRVDGKARRVYLARAVLP